LKSRSTAGLPDIFDNYGHEKTYITPVLEHIIIDKQITLVMESNGGNGIPNNPEFSKGEEDKNKDDVFGSPFEE
jgi:hypothetical protein